MGDKKEDAFSLSFGANVQKKRGKSLKIQDDVEDKREEIRSFGAESAGTSLHGEELPAIEALPNTFRCVSCANIDILCF